MGANLSTLTNVYLTGIATSTIYNTMYQTYKYYNSSGSILIAVGHGLLGGFGGAILSAIIPIPFFNFVSFEDVYVANDYGLHYDNVRVI